MDPNACLARIRALLPLMFVEDGEDYRPDQDTVTELAQHVEALDGWLSKGGFLPSAWRAIPLQRQPLCERCGKVRP